MTPDLSNLDKIRAELARYEHPLFEFLAESDPRGVKVVIRLRGEQVCDPYVFVIPPRELQDPRYGWRFQNQLFNYLHDYMVETFTRTPQRQ